jgi:hypothetical protein
MNLYSRNAGYDFAPDMGGSHPSQKEAKDPRQAGTGGARGDLLSCLQGEEDLLGQPTLSALWLESGCKSAN